MATSERAVFISYAHRDGGELALRLQKDLTSSGFHAWLDIQRLQGGASWTADIEHAIDNSSVVLALLTAGSYVSDICRAEQLRSLRKGKRVIPVLAQPGTDVPLHLEARNYRDFTTVNGYDRQFALLVADIASDAGVVEPATRFRSTYVTAPPLPRNFIDRREALASLRDAVLVDDPGPSVPITALRGMGGMGKTMLAQALCYDEAVQQAFPDGIVWTTVGKEPAYPLVTRMQELRRALGDEPGPNESELQCIDRYRTTLGGKAALVIVDDVWRTEDVEPFIANAPRSRLLFTTRDSAIAAATGAREHEAQLLTRAESRELLARWAGVAADALPPESSAMIDECERLPLALSMTGAMLRGKPQVYWGQVLKRLQQADLEKIQAQFPGYSQPNMLRVVGVSVDALDDASRERYLALAVLLEDMTVVPAVQRTLWNADEGESLETAERFVSLSLASRDGDAGGIRLHDLQLDYVRARHPDRDSLGFIRSAVRMSWHVFDRDPMQFASQVVGRLLLHRDLPVIRTFIDHVSAAAVRPWLRPLVPALRPAGMPLVHTLEGHTRLVDGVALTPDARRIVSASWDKTIKVWDMNTGELLRTLQGHDEEVAKVVVTPDGHLIVSASWDATVRVWALGSGELLRTLRGHKGIVADVSVTPDGRRIVSGSSDRTVNVWDLETGALLRTLEGHRDKVTSVAITSDGKWIVSASLDTTLKVWDLDTGAQIRALEGHASTVNAVTAGPERRAVSASRDRTLKVWDLTTGALLRTLEGHSDSVYAVALSDDGRRAVSGSKDRTTKVWDVVTGQLARSLDDRDVVRDVALSPDGQRAASASRFGTVSVWDLESRPTPVGSDTAIGDAVRDIAISFDRKQAICATTHTLLVVDLETAKPLQTLDTTRLQFECAAASADGRWAASGSWEESVKVWDLASGQLVHTLEGHTGWINGVAFTPDNRRIVSVSKDGARVWDVESGALVGFLASRFEIAAVAVAPDGKTFVTGSSEGLGVWDLETGQPLRALKADSQSVQALAIDARGRVVASGSYTKAWELETGRLLRTFDADRAKVVDVAFSPDGTQMISASGKTMRVWDVQTGEVVSAFTCDGRALCCAFVDDRRVLLGDVTGNLHALSLEHPDSE